MATKKSTRRAPSAPAKAADPKAEQALSRASTAAAFAARVAAGDVPKAAGKPTGRTGGKQQKVDYASGEEKLALVTSAATGAAQKLYATQLQGVFGNRKAVPADSIVAALAEAKVSNPRRVYRRSIRAGILVTA